MITGQKFTKLKKIVYMWNLKNCLNSDRLVEPSTGHFYDNNLKSYEKLQPWFKT